MKHKYKNEEYKKSEFYGRCALIFTLSTMVFTLFCALVITSSVVGATSQCHYLRVYRSGEVYFSLDILMTNLN